MGKYFPVVLLSLWAIIAAWSGYQPVDMAVWRVEMSSVFAIILLLVLTFRSFRFSNTAYFIVFMWLVMHTIGAHYTFENVPFGIISDFFGFERNHYDRIAHFVIGITSFMVIEWIYTESDGGDIGPVFLGPQGDIWDAQKDMLCDTLGSLLGGLWFGLFFNNKKS